MSIKKLSLLIFFIYKGLFRIIFCKWSLSQNDFKNYTIGGQNNILSKWGIIVYILI